VGASILALPIAVAVLGPLPGLAVLVALGLVNVLTVAFMAEAVSRSGEMRHGRAFFGRLVTDFLGSGGAALLTGSLLVFCFLVLQIYYFGVATTLADATPVPAAAWVAVVFLVGIYYVRRESLNATIASALVVGAVNIGLIVVLSTLAFAHATRDNLLYENVPLIEGRPFESSLIALVFGTVMIAYNGHTSVAICGQLVLRRDPSARSLIWGCAAATATAIVLYSLFVLGINGAVTPQTLARESGTALVPLAAVAGPAVHVFGSAFVVLGMGMASITYSLTLFGLVREQLPSASPRLVALPRRRGRLLFRPRRPSPPETGLRVGLLYLGLDGGSARLRVDLERGGSSRHVELAARRQCVLLGPEGLLDRLPDGRESGARLGLEIVAADDQSVRLRVSSTLPMAYDGGWDVTGLGIVEVLALSDSEAELVAWMMRQGEVSVPEVASRTGQREAAARATVESLVERGIIAEETLGEGRYAARVAPRRGDRLPRAIWEALAENDPDAGATPDDPLTHFGPRQRLRAVAFGRQGRFAIAAAPAAAAFVAAEWMVIKGSASFAGLASFVGVIVVSMLAGIFPVLLLLSSRRKGQYVPAVVYRFLGNRALLAGVYLVFVAAILLHAFVIWDDVAERAGALIAATVIVAMTAVGARRGAFARRLTIELRDDQRERRARFAVSDGGEPVSSDVRLAYRDGEQRVAAPRGDLPRFAALRSASFDPIWEANHGGNRREVKVWAHRVTPDGDSEPLPGRVQVQLAGESKEFDLELARGQVLVPLSDAACRVAVTFPEAPAASRE
jgi:amino acid permease